MEPPPKEFFKHVVLLLSLCSGLESVTIKGKTVTVIRMLTGQKLQKQHDKQEFDLEKCLNKSEL
ncbi:44809_t:CDS:1, partial [Gigaspora margarita]